MNHIFIDKKVAIIGNSSSIFLKNFGEEIDKHDVVCRINRGIIIKNETSQGKKTTVWAYGDHSIVRDLFKNYQIKETIHLSDKKRLARIKGFKERQFEKYPNTSFYVPLKNIYDLKRNLNPTENVEPSSGLIMLDFVYSSFPSSISLFGFDWKKQATWYNKSEDINDIHNWDLEKRFIANTYYKKLTIY
jgi:hypothetical protein